MTGLFKAEPIDFRGNSPRFEYKPADLADVLVELARLLAEEIPRLDQTQWVAKVSRIIFEG